MGLLSQAFGVMRRNSKLLLCVLFAYVVMYFFIVEGLHVLSVFTDSIFTFHSINLFVIFIDLLRMLFLVPVWIAYICFMISVLFLFSILFISGILSVSKQAIDERVVHMSRLVKGGLRYYWRVLGMLGINFAASWMLFSLLSILGAAPQNGVTMALVGVLLLAFVAFLFVFNVGLVAIVAEDLPFGAGIAKGFTLRKKGYAVLTAMAIAPLVLLELCSRVKGWIPYVGSYVADGLIIVFLTFFSIWYILFYRRYSRA
ncbi:hypothetical protein A374_18776 [Fictibacillus macauensis ZFHKF-1]|uniref:Uncharacterized protein n=2 Tax=Fictibacillus TaxID=1329200 RepID=I8UAC4_9BACL|nr:hypothetical protein A374_18776 [Fictibacillus macauensis ZFHKF-1]